MKNNCIMIGCMLLFSGAIFAQSVEKWFVNMPNDLNPTLSKQNRFELLENFKAKQTDSITNRYGNQARIVALDSTNQTIIVKSTSSSMLEMKMFNLETNSTTVGLISTVCAPVCQSHIQFYDTAWNKIPIKFTLPKAVEWLNEDSLENKNIDIKWIKNVLQNSFITLKFNTLKNSIIAQNNSMDFLSEADRKLILPFMINTPFEYKYTDQKWIRQY